MGGHFERMVRTIKTSLATSLQRKFLTLEEFCISLKECEVVVNNQPLTYQSADDINEQLTQGDKYYNLPTSIAISGRFL